MLRGRTRNRWLCLAALGLLAPVQVLGMAGGDDERAQVTAHGGQMLADPPPLPPEPARLPAAELAAAPVPPAVPTEAVPAAPDALLTQPDPAPSAAPEPPPPPPAVAAAAPTFADRFPAQAAATQDPADPASTRWALLIGINEHRGGVADNIGSRQDAEDLRAHLLASGWRDDHILLLTDRRATRAEIVEGLAWLAEKTDEHSVAVFHYSGHSKKWYGRDVDGDGEVTDEGLWPSDGRFIVDSELVRLLDPVRPHALWISFATCNAAGFADPGLTAPGRIATFSSGEPQKSYENPAWGNSVWGWLALDQAIGAGHGDLDRDGRVTVEEAFTWARPRASETTSRQRYGAQDAVIVDEVPGGFDLLIPGAPRPTAQSEPAPSPEQQPAPEQPQPSPGPQRDEPAPPEPDDDDDRDRDRGICILCGG